MVNHVVHRFDAKQNAEILRNARSAAAPGATLLLLDFFLDDDAVQRPIDALVSGRPWASGDSEELATLLGSGRMAVLLSRLLWEKVVLPEEPTEIEVARVTVAVMPEDVADLIAEAEGRRTYQAGS